MYVWIRGAGYIDLLINCVAYKISNCLRAYDKS